MNLPKFIVNGGNTEVDDTIHGLNEVNESLMEPVRPNWLAIEYYNYISLDDKLINTRIKGFVQLDYSLDYSQYIK